MMWTAVLVVVRLAQSRTVVIDDAAAQALAIASSTARRIALPVADRWVGEPPGIAEDRR
jgi:hypothetical protein